MFKARTLASFAFVPFVVWACAAAGMSGMSAGCSGGSSSAEDATEAGAGPADDRTTDLDASPGPSSDAEAGDAPSGAAGLGTVTSTATTCPQGANKQASCSKLSVDCSARGVAPLGATIAVTEPPGTVKGTVLLHNGSGGTVFMNVKPEMLQAGFRVVAIEWDSDWEDSPNGALAAACRPASVFKWAFDTLHQGSRTAAFCAEGVSAGSAAISYSLSHYGLGDYFDYAELVSGPPLGRIDYGCAATTYTGPPRSLCPGADAGLTPVPFAFSLGHAAQVDGWEHTTSCGSASPLPADIARWTADSVVSPGAIYDYPRTPLGFFYCTNPDPKTGANEVTGLGSFYYDQITSTKTIGCYSACDGEAVFMDPAGSADLETSLVAGCVPRHM